MFELSKAEKMQMVKAKITMVQRQKFELEMNMIIYECSNDQANMEQAQNTMNVYDLVVQKLTEEYNLLNVAT